MSNEIREMFGQVADRYDRANQILSWGVHHRWRKRAVSKSGVQSGMRVLDCATGTGDLAVAFKNAVGSDGRVVGLDFSRPMIQLASSKAQSRKVTISCMTGDVMHLPFADNSFDVSSIAFGIRNVDNPGAGLAEMARVVRPGGRVVVLEFGQPDHPLFAPLYRWYSQRIIPRVGGWISGAPASYNYLATSAAAFPAGADFVQIMRETNSFRSISAHELTLKIAYIYVGEVA